MVWSKKSVVKSAALAAGFAGVLALGSSNAVAGAAPQVPHRGADSPRAVLVRELSLRLAAYPGQVANVEGGSQQNGAPVIQYPWTGKPNERWEADAMGNGYYRFRSLSSGKCLNVEGGGTADNTRVIQYTCGTAANELWKFVPKGIGYQLVVKSSGKCLNVRGGVGEGRNLIQYTCVAAGAPNEVWLPVWEPVGP
ncbi:RICIN domain-containing protein [Streptomyces sp. NPDC052040]|uniref:RICIN domain-containing protein n=1 Tax=unclassified Streptomyces TaxID=2593676 RepID=UPI0037D24FC0